jgi:hypothetical protein
LFAIADASTTIDASDDSGTGTPLAQRKLAIVPNALLAE